MLFDLDSPGVLFATLAAGSALKALAGYWIQRDQYKYVGRVAQLYCFPIKSFRGMRVEQGECTNVGLSCYGVTDRHYAVATDNGVYLTQRQEPTMALIAVRVEGDLIVLTAPNMEPISLPLNPPINPDMLSKVTVKTDTVTSLDCGDEVAKWLCRYFKRPGLRLHFSAPSLEKRECMKNQKGWNHPAEAGDLTALHDYCGYMLLSNASLAALNQRLDSPVSVVNFRPNIIVDNCSAFEEDNWISVRIGNAELRALDSCTRCILVTVDPERGVKDKKEEPLTTLKKFRLKEPYGAKPAFGVNYTMVKPGTIHVGDPVYAKFGVHKVSPK